MSRYKDDISVLHDLADKIWNMSNAFETHQPSTSSQAILLNSKPSHHANNFAIHELF